MASSRWPTAVDYQTALQSPAACFTDPVLRSGLVMTNPLGLPLAASGNMVVVFRMTLDAGDVAIRCFTRQSTFSALQRRYLVLEALQQQANLPALVGSRFRPDELLVSGRRVAIVEMEWVRGIHLHRFAEHHLHDPSMLHALADQWRILMAQLRTARMAHGDLSDGNVLVDRQGRLRLVDYDAAYLPMLANDPPNELGKPNYQHPARLRSDSYEYGYYAENMDAFSALVIYLSLRALADDPERWDRYHTGENILFRQADFEHPGDTDIWYDLRTSDNAELLALTDTLEKYCGASLTSLPTLEEALLGQARPMHSLQTSLVAPDVEQTLELVSTEEPVEEEAPIEADHRGPRLSLWKTRRMVRLGTAAVLALLLGLFWWLKAPVASSPDTSEGTIVLTPTDLAGFYTGYATTPSGEREAVALLIDTADTDTGNLKYLINWKSYQSGGTVRYDRERGAVDLDNHYKLFIASANENNLVLETRSPQANGPQVKVIKSNLSQ